MSVPYEVGVRLFLREEATPILAVLSGHFLTLNNHVNQLAENWGRVRTAAMGALAVFSGDRMLHGLTHLIERTQDISHAVALVKRLNVGADQEKMLRDYSFNAPHQIKGIDQKDVLDVYREGFSMFGHEHMMELLPNALKTGLALGHQSGKPEQGMNELKELFRSGELAGAFTSKETGQVDVERANKFFDMATRMVESTGGLVTPQTLLSLSKQGGLSLRGLSDEGWYTMAMASQAMGGGRAGTAMMSLFQQFAGGTMWKATAEELQKVGILQPNDWKYEQNKVHMTKQGSERMSGLLGEDPLKWISQELFPKLEAAGFHSRSEKILELFKILQRQTTQRFTGEQMANFDQLLAERERIMNTGGFEAALKIANETDVTQNLQNLHKAWSNLLQTIGGANSQQFVGWLDSIREHIDAFSKFAESHQEAIKTATTIFAGAAIGLIVGGLVAIAAALGAPGWLAIGAVTAAFSLLSSYNWGSIDEGVRNVIHALDSLSDKLKNFALSAFDNLKTWWGRQSAPTNPGVIPGEDPTGLFQKQNYRSVPPAPGAAGGGMGVIQVNLDGRAVGEGVMRYLADQLGGPATTGAYPSSASIMDGAAANQLS